MIKLTWALIKLGWRAFRLAFTIRRVLRATRVRRGTGGRCKWDPGFAEREAARVRLAEAMHAAVTGRTAGTRQAMVSDYDARPIEGGLPWGQYPSMAMDVRTQHVHQDRGPGGQIVSWPRGVSAGEPAHPGLAGLYLAEDEVGRIAELGKSGRRWDELVALGRMRGWRPARKDQP